MALEKFKTIIPVNSESYNNAKLFYEVNQEIDEKIESRIKEKLEISLKSTLLSIERQNRRNNEEEKFKDAILGLKAEIQNTTRELENYKQDVKLQRESDKNFLASNINETRKRFEEQLELNFIGLSELFRESENKNREIEALRQEMELQKKNSTLLLKIEKKAEEYDKIINSQSSDLMGLKNSISDLIKNIKSFEDWKQEIELNKANQANMMISQLKNLEERLGQQSKKNDEMNNQLAEAKEFYTGLRDDAEKFKDTILDLKCDFQNVAREHENCKQEVKLQRENDKNFLVNQIDEIKKRLKELLEFNSIEKLSEKLKGNISELMREDEKTNKKIEDLKQEIEKENNTLLLKIDKKEEEHDKIINSQNSDLTGLKNSVSGLMENMKSFEQWKQEIELNKINEANMVKSQLKNLEERFEQQIKINEENNHQLKEAKEFIAGLIDDAEKFKDTTKEFKNYKQEVKFQSQSDKNFLSSQINEIKKRLEEQAKLNSMEKFKIKIEGSVAELIRGADKTNELIEALKQEIGLQKKNDTLFLKIVKKTEEHDKIINSQNSDLMGLKNSTSDMIKNIESFEDWKKEIELNKANEANMTKSQLKNLEERFEQQCKMIDEKNNQLAEAKEFIIGLRADAEKSKNAILDLSNSFQNIARKHENYEQEVKVQRESDKNFLVGQINVVKSRFDEKVNPIEKLSKEIKGNISELMRRAEKTNREIEALKQEIGFHKKNSTLLLKIEKNAEEHYKIINSQSSELAGLTNSVSDLIKNMKSFEDWNQEIELNKSNELNVVKSELKNLEERFEHQSKMIDEKYNQLAELKEFITGLRDDVEKNKSDLETWKKEIERKMKINIDTSLVENQLKIIIAESNKRIISNLNMPVQAKNELNQTVENKDSSPEGLKAKTSKLLSQTFNLDVEKDFRNTVTLYENEQKEALSSDPQLAQDYKDYVNAYRLKTSIFLINKNETGSDLYIYGTETETEKVNVLTISEKLNVGTCITQLPNGDLFLFGKDAPPSGIALLIDKNCRIRFMPSGTACAFSSATYFDSKIYCFGGTRNGPLTLADRFDLNTKMWIRLKSLPEADSYCHCIVFNRVILICGSINANILSYSIDSDTYIKIPFEFSPRKRKIIIDAGRLYLIEFGGKIYESEAEDYYMWRQIGESGISNNCPAQVYHSYNKEAIYIAVNFSNERYYKFELRLKQMILIQ